MKRSCAGDNSPIIKKKVRDNKDITNSTEESSNDDNNNMSVLEYVHQLVDNLEQGNIDNCLSNNSSDFSTILQQLSKSDADLFTQLDLNIRKIAQRQLQLETENLRCRIMIQQQHQLLTSTTTTPNHHEEEKVMHKTNTTENNHTTTTTSEDDLTSVHDTSLLENLETSYRHMPELPQGGYFGAYIFLLICN